jgi:ABC-type Zn uptake system ZnuABC Zn-binding protein ZnuA
MMARFLLKLIVVLLAATGCASQISGAGSLAAENSSGSDLVALELPPLQSVDLGKEKLRVVATTSIVGDIVSQVGGDFIDLETLMSAGQDPHSFELSPKDLTSLVEAQVIFVNGWDLEEGLVDDLANAAEDAAIVPVSAGIAPLTTGLHSHGDGGEIEEESNGSPDPHTWLDPRQVVTWIENVTQVLSSLDPDRADGYQANADSFLGELQELIDYFDVQTATLPAGQRRLVTSHDSLAYFAAAYDFDIVGTVIPAASTLAEPSSGELAGLIETMEEEGICAIFTEVTASDQLARTAAKELGSCDEVKVISLYTGALGSAGSRADEYLTMMRSNIDAIVEGLKDEG